MAFVTIRIKNTEGHTRSELLKDRVTIGRSSSADLPIRNNTLSREHCAFVREGERWFVEDLGSQNGTWVNRTKVLGRTPLAERDIVKAGQSRLTFHEGAMTAVNEPAGDEDVAALEVGLDDDASPAAKAPLRTLGADDPPEAVPCGACGGWFSIAHRLAGDEMACPRCGHKLVVPQISA